MTGGWERRIGSGALYADGRGVEWDGRGGCGTSKCNAKRCANSPVDPPSTFFFGIRYRVEAVALMMTLRTAQALYAYVAQSEAELSLAEGDVVDLTPTGMDAAEGWAEVSNVTSLEWRLSYSGRCCLPASSLLDGTGD